MLEQDNYFTLGKPVEINRNKMSIPIETIDGSSFQIQLPDCKTKQGVVSNGSRTYVDLMFDNTKGKEFLVEFEEFISVLQSKCAEEIYKNRADWLAVDSEEDNDSYSVESFEEIFYPVTRAINRGANTVIRVDIGRGTRGTKPAVPVETSCEIYTKTGEEKSLSAIQKDSKLIPLVEFSEILISSTSINLVLELKECLLFDETTQIVKRGRSIMLEENDEESKQEDKEIENEGVMKGQAEFDKNIVEKEADCDEIVEQVDIEDTEDSSISRQENECQSNDLTLHELTEVDIELDEKNTSEIDSQIQEDNDGLTEIKDLEIVADEPLKLKRPNEVYREIYKAAIAKAKRLRQVALDAYLDAKKIKARFMLDEIEDSDDDSDDGFFEEEKTIST